jgi:hypothetical protein
MESKLGQKNGEARRPVAVDKQKLCCDTVRLCLQERLATNIVIVDEPDKVERRLEAVEEVWESAVGRYAVEHTRVEAFEGQIRDDAAFLELVGPLEEVLRGNVPGRFTVFLPVGLASRSKVPLDETRQELLRLIVENIAPLSAGESTTVASNVLRCEVGIVRRHANESRVLFGRSIGASSNRFGRVPDQDNVIDEARKRRIDRALDRKIPKLVAAATNGAAQSVLILESDDIALSNVFEVARAFEPCLVHRVSLPDLVFLVETDGGQPFVWTLKDGPTLFPENGRLWDSTLPTGEA